VSPETTFACLLAAFASFLLGAVGLLTNKVRNDGALALATVGLAFWIAPTLWAAGVVAW
jgi:hypothetical protein